MLKKIALLSLGVASAFAMHTGELNINDKDLQLKVNLDLGQFNPTVEPDTTYVGASYLKASDEHSEDEYKNKISPDGYYETNFLMKREVNNSGFLFGIGIKANYASIRDKGISNGESRSFVSIPLGIEAGYKIPSALPIVVDAKVYYAPESLAFADANNFLEYGFNVGLEIIERGSIIAGYRSIDTNIKVNTVKTHINYNKSGYFGFKFAF